MAHITDLRLGDVLWMVYTGKEITVNKMIIVELRLYDVTLVVKNPENGFSSRITTKDISSGHYESYKSEHFFFGEQKAKNFKDDLNKRREIRFKQREKRKQKEEELKLKLPDFQEEIKGKKILVWFNGQWRESTIGDCYVHYNHSKGKVEIAFWDKVYTNQWLLTRENKNWKMWTPEMEKQAKIDNLLKQKEELDKQLKELENEH